MLAGHCLPAPRSSHLPFIAHEMVFAVKSLTTGTQDYGQCTDIIYAECLAQVLKCTFVQNIRLSFRFLRGEDRCRLATAKVALLHSQLAAGLADVGRLEKAGPIPALNPLKLLTVNSGKRRVSFPIPYIRFIVARHLTEGLPKSLSYTEKPLAVNLWWPESLVSQTPVVSCSCRESGRAISFGIIGSSVQIYRLCEIERLADSPSVLSNCVRIGTRE